MSVTALPKPGSDDVLYIVDLSNYVFRAYHALPDLTNSHGEPTHATLGTLNMLNRMVEDQRPAYMAVAMDTKGRGFRGELDPNYKANRSATPPDLLHQLSRCREIFEGYRVPLFSAAGFEADDLIASLTRHALAADLRVVIMSSDKDLMQLLVSEKVIQWDAMRNRVFGPAEVEQKYGVGPSLMRDFLALVGDSSDNIPGIPGVGPKTAAKLLLQYGTLNKILASTASITRKKLKASLEDESNIEKVRRGYQLIGLRADVALTFDKHALHYGNPDVPRLRELFTELQFTRFLDILDRDYGTAEGGGGGLTAPAPAAEITPQIVSSVAQLEAVVLAARASGRLAIAAFGPGNEAMRMPLIGVALAPAAGDASYLPIAHRYLAAPPQVPLDEVRRVLGPLLADPAVAKLGHDLKQTQVVLAHHQLPVAGARFDSLLASYLLDPETTHKLGIIAERDARMRWLDFEKLVPKTRKGPKLTIEQIDVERASQYGCAYAEACLRLADNYTPKLAQEGLRPLHDDVEMVLLDILTQMELCGVLLDPEPLNQLAISMRRELQQLEKQGHQLAGREFNLASPKQLDTILFDQLGLRSTRKTKTGRSTDHDALEAIQHDHALPKLILQHRATAKLLGTYVEALPKLIHPETGRIHTRWDQAVAATGRISSRDPNLQNIPIRSEHGKRIREAFVAPPGYTIISCDYSQIELRVLAHLSHDPKLVEAFNRGQDVHVRTAMEVFGVDEADVTPTMRSQSKTVNFGVIYGMGAVALGKKLGISRTEAKRFIDAYFERYEGVRTFMETTLAHARKTKTVRTVLGRRRRLPDLHSSNRARRAYAERIAQNTPIQGSAADLLKLAMVKLANPVVPGAKMVLTVHDELVFEVPDQHVEEALAKTKSVMESVYPLDVPLVVDVGSGPHWAAAH